MTMSDETRRQREEVEKSKAETLFWIYFRNLSGKRSGNALWNWFEAHPEVDKPFTNKSKMGEVVKKYDFEERAAALEAKREQQKEEAHTLQRRSISDQLFRIAEQEAIDVLRELMHSEDEKIRLQAAQSFLDRTIGVPSKAGQSTGNQGQSPAPPPPDADEDTKKQWYASRLRSVQ